METDSPSPAGCRKSNFLCVAILSQFILWSNARAGLAAIQSSVLAWGSTGFNVPADLTNGVAVAGGVYFGVVLKNDGTVKVLEPPLGGAPPGVTNVPAGLSNVIAVACGDAHVLALKREGTAVAWGGNRNGQTNVPVGLSNVVSIAGGAGHSIAARSDGTVVAWGSNTYGQTNVPSGLTDVVAVSGGWGHSLALKKDGTVVGWGTNWYGLAGGPQGLANVTAIASGEFNNLALKNDGTIVAWGQNAYGQTNVPSDLKDVVAIACGMGYHNLALKRDGTISIWGNTGVESLIPPGLGNVLAVGAGNDSSLVIVAGEVPTFAPQIIFAASLQHGQCSFLVPTFNRKQYVLERNDSLLPTGWTAVAVKNGDGTYLKFLDQMALGENRFYRAKLTK